MPERVGATLLPSFRRSKPTQRTLATAQVEPPKREHCLRPILPLLAFMPRRSGRPSAPSAAAKPSSNEDYMDNPKNASIADDSAAERHLLTFERLLKAHDAMTAAEKDALANGSLSLLPAMVSTARPPGLDGRPSFRASPTNRAAVREGVTKGSATSSRSKPLPPRIQLSG